MTFCVYKVYLLGNLYVIERLSQTTRIFSWYNGLYIKCTIAIVYLLHGFLYPTSLEALPGNTNEDIMYNVNGITKCYILLNTLFKYYSCWSSIFKKQRYERLCLYY